MISETVRQQIARRFLGRYKGLEENLKSLEESAARARDIALRTTSAPDKIVVDRSKNPHKFDEILAENLELIDSQRARLLVIQREINTVIGMIEDNQYQYILREKYINGRTYEWIGEAIGYGPDWVKELTNRALLIVYDKIIKITPEKPL